MNGWCKLEFNTQEEADAFEATYCELLEKVNAYKKEVALSDAGQVEHNLTFWVNFADEILKTAFKLAQDFNAPIVAEPEILEEG